MEWFYYRMVWLTTAHNMGWQCARLVNCTRHWRKLLLKHPLNFEIYWTPFETHFNHNKNLNEVSNNQTWSPLEMLLQQFWNTHETSLETHLKKVLKLAVIFLYTTYTFLIMTKRWTPHNFSTSLHCNVLQSIALYCIALYCIVLYNVPRHLIWQNVFCYNV